MGIQANHIGIDTEDYRSGHEYLFRGISSLSQHTRPHLELEENRSLDSEPMGDYAKCEAFSHTQGFIYNPDVVSGNNDLPFETQGNAIEQDYAFEMHFDSKKHHRLSSMEQGNRTDEREEVGFMDNPNVYKECDYPSEFPAIEMHFNSKKLHPLSSMEQGNQTHERAEVGFMDNSNIYEESDFPAIGLHHAFEMHFDLKKHHLLSSMEEGNQTDERVEVGFMDNPNIYEESDFPSEFSVIEPNYEFKMHFDSKKYHPLSSMEQGNQTDERDEVGFMDNPNEYSESDYPSEFPAIEPNYAFEMHFDSKKHCPLSSMEQGNQTNERVEVGFMDNPNICEESDVPSKFPSHIGGLTKARKGSKGSTFNIVPEEGIEDNMDSECNSYYLDYFGSQTPRSLNVQSLHGINSLSQLSVLDVVSEDRPLGEFCPFNAETNNKEWDTLSSSSSGSETSYEGPLDCLTSLLDSLPVKKGLSRFYSGKSRSFSCLSDVVSLKDVVKIENPLNTKRRRMNSSRFGPWRQNNIGGISKKLPHNGKTTLALAVAMSKNEDIDRQLHPSIPSRSLSLSDLRGVDR